MAATIEEITINFEEDGVQVVKEMEKEVLSKGAWSTILFKYQQFDKKTNEYAAPQYTIRRYRKVKGEYMPQSKFNISSDEQARKIAEILLNWIDQK
jgi:hypothetical protein